MKTMHTNKILAMFAAAMLLWIIEPLPGDAEVPQQISYQGYLTDDMGDPVTNGNYSMVFTVYALASGGTALWSETQTTVAVTGGIYNVQIGQNPIGNPFPPDLFDSERYLGVKVGSDAEMTPRQPITSVAFAMRTQDADDADMLGGIEASDYALSDHGHDWWEISNRPAGLDDGDDVGITIETDPTVLSSVKDGVSWWELSGIPAGFADNVDDIGITTETDPTVNPSVKDGVSWGEISAIPAGFADGVDNVGITSEIDPQVGSISTNRIPKWNGSTLVSVSIHDVGNIGIGTTSPNAEMELYKNQTAATELILNNPNGGNNAATSIRFYEGGSAKAGLFSANSGNTVPLGGPNSLSIRNWHGPILIDAYSGVILEPYDGNVGIGTYDPSSKLEVTSDDLTAGKFTSDYASSSTRVLKAEYTGTDFYDAAAIEGYCKPQDYYGYGGIFEGGYVGVLGRVYAEGSNSYMGVRGSASGGSGTNYGVYGYAGGGATNYAGYFSGNVHISGTLSKANGTFKIDHPLDPENKYLQHSFVESPDMMNIYNGNVVLDDIGEALVELPEWFEALNRDFRYQLTAIGAPGPNLYIAEEISDNTFRIAGGEAGMKVSWHVTGIRQDPWANANRLAVELEKPASEQGYYLHPEVYGKSREQGVDWAHKQEARRDSEE